eukprot:EG_transcript_32825
MAGGGNLLLICEEGGRHTGRDPVGSGSGPGALREGYRAENRWSAAQLAGGGGAPPPGAGGRSPSPSLGHECISGSLSTDLLAQAQSCVTVRWCCLIASGKTGQNTQTGEIQQQKVAPT